MPFFPGWGAGRVCAGQCDLRGAACGEILHPARVVQPYMPGVECGGAYVLVGDQQIEVLGATDKSRVAKRGYVQAQVADVGRSMVAEILSARGDIAGNKIVACPPGRLCLDPVGFLDFVNRVTGSRHRKTIVALRVCDGKQRARQARGA